MQAAAMDASCKGWIFMFALSARPAASTSPAVFPEDGMARFGGPGKEAWQEVLSMPLNVGGTTRSVRLSE